MSHLLKILPVEIKTELSKFFYSQAINVHRFLQNRDDSFYAKYLEELKDEQFNSGEIIVKEGNQADCVYFIMSGVVQNLSTNRYFESGQMINYDLIMKNAEIQHTYKAISEVSLLKYDRVIFKQILDQFPDMLEDITRMVNEQEKMEESQIVMIKGMANKLMKQQIWMNYTKILLNEKKQI